MTTLTYHYHTHNGGTSDWYFKAMCLANTDRWIKSGVKVRSSANGEHINVWFPTEALAVEFEDELDLYDWEEG